LSLSVCVSDVEYKLFIFHVLLLEAATTVSMFFNVSISSAIAKQRLQLLAMFGCCGITCNAPHCKLLMVRGDGAFLCTNEFGRHPHADMFLCFEV
jgi:hypothetical protein